MHEPVVLRILYRWLCCATCGCTAELHHEYLPLAVDSMMSRNASSPCTWVAFSWGEVYLLSLAMVH